VHSTVYLIEGKKKMAGQEESASSINSMGLIFFYAFMLLLVTNLVEDQIQMPVINPSMTELEQLIQVWFCLF
jgi:hypothetical protein